MRKKCFYAAALAMMLASCSQELETPQLQVQEGKPAIAGETPIGFNVYTNRPITRAGITGDLNTDRLKDLDDEDGRPGFGVFAYYTDNLDYTCQTKPNFMYNQQVQAMDEETWTYEPVKYWPNEFGDAAQSKDQDKVSFFAYAPYVECDPATGKLIDDADTPDDDESKLDTYGITGFSKNTFAGDPYVKYIATFDMAQAVDLCYGTVASGYERWSILNGGVQDLEEGMPYLSVEHPAKLDQKMKFNFRHALAQLNVKIDVDADVNSHAVGDGTAAAAGTKVYVRSISFKGFAMKGALNLNNTEYDKARWMHYNGQGLLSAADAETFVVNDGRKNGKEGTTAAASEKNAFLNQSIISDDGNTTPGVTGDQVNLFKLDLSNATFADPENPTAEEILALQAAQLNNSVYVIPVDPDEPMSVTIVYDVETSDDKLASQLSDGTKGSRVRNEITKEISFNGGGLKSGYKHTINLHLGLNSVKFDAAVSGWSSNGGNANSWLPITENPGEGTFNPGNSLHITSINGGAPAEDMSGSNAVKAAIMGINGGTNTMSVQSDSDEDGSTEWMIENTQIAAIAAAGAPSRAGTRNAVPEGYAARATGKAITVAPIAAGTTILHSTYKGKESTIVITVVAPSMKLSASSVNLYAFPTDSKTGSVEVTWNAPSIYEGDLPTVASVVSDNEAIATASETEGVITITPVGEAGTANLTVTDTDGNIKTVSVKVTKASLAVNKTTLTLIKGKEFADLKFTATPSATFEDPEDVENGYQLQYTMSNNGDVPFTFEDGVIKAVSELAQDMEGKMTVQFVGHEGENDPKVEVTVNVLATDITAMKADAQAVNPLWKVAQYNVASNGTSFLKKHSTTSQFVFNLNDAKGISIDGYHLPSAAELAAILPTHNSAGNGTNIFAQNNATFVYPAANASGELAEASGKGGQFVQNGAQNDLYACRKLGDNLTAWHYKWVTSPCNGLLIESYVLESTEDSPENMAKIASALPASDVWSSAEANEKPESSSSESSLVTRFLPAVGLSTGGSSVANTHLNSHCIFWSSTDAPNSKFFRLNVRNTTLMIDADGGGQGCSVRLFHND